VIVLRRCRVDGFVEHGAKVGVVDAILSGWVFVNTFETTNFQF
jgi:hypothetical protein